MNLKTIRRLLGNRNKKLNLPDGSTEGLSAESQTVISRSYYIAKDERLPEVDTTCILISLLQVDAIRGFLVRWNIDDHALRAVIATSTRPHRRVRRPKLNQAASTCIHDARLVAKYHKANEVSPEHIFLGLLLSDTGVGDKYLRRKGIRYSEARAELVGGSKSVPASKESPRERRSVPVKKESLRELSVESDLARLAGERRTSDVYVDKEVIEVVGKWLQDPNPDKILSTWISLAEICWENYYHVGLLINKSIETVGIDKVSSRFIHWKGASTTQRSSGLAEQQNRLAELLKKEMKSTRKRRGGS